MKGEVPRILFLIYSRSHASGGHFHSLDQISGELGKHFPVAIVTLGKESQVLSRNPYFKAHWPEPDNWWKSISFFKNLTRDFQPNVINCFDTESFNIALLQPFFWPIHKVLTKCGGPNPQRFRWQYAHSMIFFSLENYKWFSRNSFYKGSQLHLIPNRVTSLSMEESNKHIEKKATGKFNFLRIQRLGGAYEKTMRDIFNLIHQIQVNYPVHLFVVGTIQSKEKFDSLVQEANRLSISVQFITDERAAKASDFLYLADAVIGTGRSFMEAASMGIPVLAPASNASAPVLITKDNFDSFFEANFSERAMVSEQDLRKNSIQLTQLLESPDFCRHSGEQARELFDLHFGTGLIVTRYKTVYQDILREGVRTTLLLIKNSLYLARTLFSK